MSKRQIFTVLIVEDEPLVRMVASDAFGEAGFAVIEAQHAAEALALFVADGSIHLLFTDVNMPGALSGIDLAEHIAFLQPSIRIVVTSALPILRPIDHLGASFLSKPYVPGAAIAMAFGLLAA